MKQILVISDNELLNQLYQLNLEIYIGANVTILKDIDSAKDVFDNIEKFDLIITMSLLSENEIGYMCALILKEKDLETPLILIGNPIKEIPRAIVIQSSYNVQNLIRSAASILGVTAKQMVEFQVEKYYPIAISHLSHLSVSPSTLFLQVMVLNDHYEYVACIQQDSPLSPFISKLQNEGVTHLFVNSQERLNVINKISYALILRLSNSESENIKVKTKSASEGFSFVANQLVDNPEAVQELITIAEGCSILLTSVVSELTSMKPLLQLLLDNKDGYIYMHSVLISYVANHIVQHISWGADAHIERLNFMIFFHDIFLVKIYDKHPEINTEEDLLIGSILTDEEKYILLNHAKLAGDQLLKYKKCPPGVDVLIKQHHGMGNGIGFAAEFGDNISPLSKLFMIAESFVADYLQNRMKDQEFKIDIQLAVLKLHEKYPKHTYRKLIDTLKNIKM
jgi:HD-GYP domain-containing protein (c-di-GMP phosphodiesterase class II)